MEPRVAGCDVTCHGQHMPCHGAVQPIHGKPDWNVAGQILPSWVHLVGTPKAKLVLTPAQLKMARAALDWTREELGRKSDTSHETIKNFELKGTDPRQQTIIKWMKALRLAGIILIDEDERGGPGVRLRKS